jgi:phage gp45-like
MKREIAHALRSLVMRGVVRTSSDQGESQTAKVTIAAGIERSDVEVMQPFGLASHAPAGGAAVVLAVGGDTGDLVLLPVSSPGFRLGGLAEGEAALYAIKGDRVHAKADGSIEILASARVLIKVGDVTIEATPDYVKATKGDAELELTASHARGKFEGSRFVASASAAKLVSGGNFVAVAPGGITSSVPIVVGSDPDPGS